MAGVTGLDGLRCDWGQGVQKRDYWCREDPKKIIVLGCMVMHVHSRVLCERHFKFWVRGGCSTCGLPITEVLMRDLPSGREEIHEVRLD